MEGRVLEENVFDEPLVDTRIDVVARFYNVLKHHAALYYDECPHLSLSHVHARHDDWENCFAVYAFLVLVASEQFQYILCFLVCTEIIEKVAYFLLEEHDKSDYSHRDQLVHDASQEAHFQYLTDDKPDNDEYHNAREHVERTRFFHDAIGVVEHECHQHDIDDVL